MVQPWAQAPPCHISHVSIDICCVTTGSESEQEPLTVPAPTCDWLAEAFEMHRPHLTAVAYRMLGSLSEAEDAVQDVWLDLSRANATAIQNLRGWLTTVVARVCLDRLRSRTSRREEPYGLSPPQWLAQRHGTGDDPLQEALIGDSVGFAFMVLLDELTPAERIAFVLHDIFDLRFEEIAQILARSPAAARQLASRGRRQVRRSSAKEATLTYQRQAVEAFLSAARNGDFAALLTVLDPDVVLRADAVAERAGAFGQRRGAAAVADAFAGGARGAELALIDGAPGLAWAPRGQPRGAFKFSFSGGRIVAIDIIGSAEHLRRMDLRLLGTAVVADRSST
jgi:RNA polymerase sigma factor (sigma-70 family)